MIAERIRSGGTRAPCPVADEVVSMRRRPHPAKKRAAKKASPASSDWRGTTLARVRALIKQADPDAVEEVKWRKPSNPAGVPVWSHDGPICTGETYKSYVK